MYDTIFSDFLSELDVPHTHCYSDRKFCTMPFQSLFGLKKLLQSYGVESEGLRFDDKTKIDMLPVPFFGQNYRRICDRDPYRKRKCGVYIRRRTAVNAAQ